MPAPVSTDISSHLTKRARCPRCGYSLRGAVESWHESCPLNGVCSECGFAYLWAEMLNDKLYRPRWTIEFVLHRKFISLALLTTAICSFVPWFFWSKLRMSHEMQWKRLGVYLLILFTIIWLTYATANTVIVGRAWIEVDQNPQITRLSRPLEYAGLYAFVLPSSRKPVFTYTFTHIIQGVPSSSTIAYSSPKWLKRVWRWNGDVTFFMCFFIVALPATFMLLPVSRRRARVRWRHISRVFAYSLLFPALVSLGIIVGAFRAYRSEAGYSYRPLPVYVDYPRYLCLLAIGMLALWWWVAIRRYLHMDEPRKVALSVIVTSLLLATVATYLVYTDFVKSLMGWIMF